MSNTNLTSYNFHDSNIRVEQNDKGEVLFCLADVCKSLNWFFRKFVESTEKNITIFISAF